MFAGKARVGDQADRGGATASSAMLGGGGEVRLRGPQAGGAQAARLLLLAGVPLSEPVARYGPFVMNTRQELVQAVEDFQSGRMGEITRTAQVS